MAAELADFSKKSKPFPKPAKPGCQRSNECETHGSFSRTSRTQSRKRFSTSANNTSFEANVLGMNTEQSTCRQLRLILWKNFILRRRHWILTLLEITVSMILMSIIVYVRTATGSLLLPQAINEVTTFPEVEDRIQREEFCKHSLGSWDYCYDVCSYPIIGYTPILFWGPNTTFTQEMIKIIIKDINFDEKYLRLVPNRTAMDKIIEHSYVLSFTHIEKYFLGIYFHVNESDPKSIPFKLKYELRMPKYWFTDYIYPFFQIPGPRTNSAFRLAASYLKDGFLFMQSVIDKAFMKITSKENDYLDSVRWAAQVYPYPPYITDFGISNVYTILFPAIIVLCLAFLSPTLIKSIVSDKQTGVRELMRIMGVESWVIWVGWFLYSFFTVLLLCIMITIALKIEVPSQDDHSIIIPPILPYSDSTLMFTILLFYGISSICFCLSVSCFFSKPTLATTIGVLVWLISYFVPSTFIDNNYIDMSLGLKLFCCTVPSLALKLMFNVSNMFEGRAIGLRWDNLWDVGNSRDQLTPGMIIIMLLLDIFLYIFVTWYVDKISPGKYGVAKPWYFVFEWLPWLKERKQRDSHIPHHIPNQQSEPGYMEEEPNDLRAGIRTQNLRKVFKNINGHAKVAVEDVTLTCFEGQCTVLLGHNGAGKSTTMSIITGIYSPTRGYAEVNGWDIKQHLRQARSCLGLCPQHNTLFNDLTVQEHLLFFGQLKGLTYTSAKEEADGFLSKLELQDKKNAFGKMLSGGMKRKLCLSIALIGGSKTVILDEPSSGMDPESRRKMWDVIQMERESRTVLITTHHMEEADALGDRIAIMSHGQVLCCGSSLFLKNTFGDGYALTVRGQEGTDVTEIEKIVFENFGVVPMEQSEGFYYSFKLPNKTTKFPTLLDELSSAKERLLIDHIGLSITSMDEVFFRVGELSGNLFGEKHNNTTSVSDGKYKALENSGENAVADGENQKNTSNEVAVNISPTFTENFSGGLFYNQKVALRRMKYLLMKKILYTKRKWILFVTQAIIPVLITITCIAVDSSFSGGPETEPPVSLSLDMFAETTSTLQCTMNCREDENKIFMSYSKLFGGKNKIDITENTTATLLEYSYEDITKYRENCIASLVIDANEDGKTLTKIMYQSIPYHAAGIGMNLQSNALLKSLSGDEYEIATINSPLPPPKSVKLDQGTSKISSFLYGMVMPVALCFLTSSFLVFPLEERISNSKQIQLMTGTSSFLMWTTSYLFDVVSYLLTGIAVFICFMAWDSNGVFTINGAPGALFTVIMLYGVSAIPLSYILSFLYNSAASGFAALTLINITAGMIISLVTLILGKTGSKNMLNISYIVGNITSIIPAYPVSKAFIGIVGTSEKNKLCDIFFALDEKMAKKLCKKLHKFYSSSEYLACCPDYCDQTVGCFEYTSYFEWGGSGVAYPLLYFSVDIAIFGIIFWMLELKAGSFIQPLFWRLYHRVFPPLQSITERCTEEDVNNEREEASKMMEKNNLDESSVVVLDLKKVLHSGNITPVDKISFAVKTGECLGLLGVNGAGKTTTFRMMTGDEDPTSGEVRIGNYFLSNNKHTFLRNIGYCPQFDALIGELTGEELLTLMGGLRGMDKRTLEKEVKSLIKLVDITECANRLSSTYSGGNKRKLSAAMALIGRPPVILLDEPTAGVDPVSRRRVWEAIRQAISNGQSIILTSHSMDECEALCSKIVIMAKGMLRCSGSSVHLKAKYGVGRQLHIKLLHALPQETGATFQSKEDAERRYQDLVSNLKTYLSAQFTGSSLEDEHRGMLSYRIPNKYSWSSIFSIMESLKSSESQISQQNEKDECSEITCNPFHIIIEDYAALNPTLEQVFLSFAREST